MKTQQELFEHILDMLKKDQNDQSLELFNSLPDRQAFIDYIIDMYRDNFDISEILKFYYENRNSGELDIS